MVFRKGGFLASTEKWHLDGKVLEIVNEYNYLGFVFTTKMSLNKGVHALASKGKKACFGCVRTLSKERFQGAVTLRYLMLKYNQSCYMPQKCGD